MKHISLFIIIIGLSACSNIWNSNQRANESLPEIPFTLEVKDEVNDGDRLHILGNVRAMTEWKVKDVVVKLTSFANGNIVGSSYLALSKIPKKLEATIKPDTDYQFTISVPSANISDYQLELLWGEEAKRYIGSIEHEPSGVLEIRNIQVETIRQPCEGVNCQIKFKAKAKIFNSTARAITNVTLGIGYLRIKKISDNLNESSLVKSDMAPFNEELIDIGSIYLMPNNSRDISIDFDKEIPEVDLITTEGELKPSIRILSFKTE